MLLGQNKGKSRRRHYPKRSFLKFDAIKTNSLINRVFLVFLFISSIKTFAQYPQVRESIINLPNFDKKILHYGYYIGFNSYDFKFEYEKNYYEDQIPDIVTTGKTGFNVD